MPADLIEKPVSKKREMEPSIDFTAGGPSKWKFFIAMTELAIAKPKIIPDTKIALEKSFT